MVRLAKGRPILSSALGAWPTVGCCVVVFTSGDYQIRKNSLATCARALTLGCGANDNWPKNGN